MSGRPDLFQQTGVLNSCYPYPGPVLEAVERTQGSAWEDEKAFQKTRLDVFSPTRVGGLTHNYGPSLRGPHESGATSFLIEAVFIDTDGPEK
jgi:hypothetical protein